MLQVSDNLERALAAVPDQSEGADNGLKTLVEGVELTGNAQCCRRWSATACASSSRRARNSIRISTRPCSRCPITEVPNNTVIDVVQPGYVIADRMLRPAMVGVSKGGPKETA
jgi:molecular chaperone GrpE